MERAIAEGPRVTDKLWDIGCRKYKLYGTACVNRDTSLGQDAGSGKSLGASERSEMVGQAASGKRRQALTNTPVNTWLLKALVSLVGKAVNLSRVKIINSDSNK